MKIEAVTVCVGYADFLAATLPWNMQQFDHLVVVTSYDDKETQRLCRRLSVECRPTDVMYFDGDPFNKGRAIDFGLSFIGGRDWIAHVDADTWLPPMTRHHLTAARLDPEFIYGIDRALCPNYEAWQSFIRNDVPAVVWDCPTCGIPNIVETMADLTADQWIELRRQAGFEPNEPIEAEVSPTSVTCIKCNDTFAVEDTEPNTGPEFPRPAA